MAGLLLAALWTLEAQAQTAHRPSASTATPPNAAVIAGGRGRVANVKATSFTVLWLTGSDTPGQVRFGPDPSLGRTAPDVRGPSYTGQTHYVDVTGLLPSTPYFFDLAGGEPDDNLGQHFQVTTGPLIVAPPRIGYLEGLVRPAAGGPASGVLVWGHVKDGNGQGSAGTSRLIASLTGSDGAFRLDLNPRVDDLSEQFTYSSSGDQVELWARTTLSEATITVDTSTVRNGGTTPAPAQIGLVAAAPPPTRAPSPTIVLPSPTTVPTAAPAGPLSTSPISLSLSTAVPLTAAGPTAAVGAATATTIPAPTAAPTVRPPTVRAPAVAQPTAPTAPPPTPTRSTQIGGGVVFAAPPSGAVAPPTAVERPAEPLPPSAVSAPARASTPTTSPNGIPVGIAALPALAEPGGAGAPAVVAVVPATGSGRALPYNVAAFFYGGIALSLLGAGLTVLAVATGRGWRPP